MGKAGTDEDVRTSGEPTLVCYDEGQRAVSRGLVASFVSVAITWAPAHVPSHPEPISTLGRARRWEGGCYHRSGESSCINRFR